MNEYERHMGAAGDPAGAGSASGGNLERSPEEIQHDQEAQAVAAEVRREARRRLGLPEDPHES